MLQIEKPGALLRERRASKSIHTKNDRRRSSSANCSKPQAIPPPYRRPTHKRAYLARDAWHPGMWRVFWPDGERSDLVNLSRAKDALATERGGHKRTSSAPPRKKYDLNAPVGSNQFSEGNDNVITRQGNSRAYTLDRLKRQAPELFERVISGELSANAAAIEAGFRKKRRCPHCGGEL